MQAKQQYMQQHIPQAIIKNQTQDMVASCEVSQNR